MCEKVKKLMADLAEPFPIDQVGFKPAGKPTASNRVCVVAYIDARDVMDRLDQVVGAENWKAEPVWHEGGLVECRLSIRVNGEWIAKTDVGGESEQPDPHDKAKAAVSDALKRAAVHWGIGRYLYRLDDMWVDWDADKRRPKGKPQLPVWALPKPRIKEVKEVKEEPVDLQQLAAALAILAQAVPQGRDAFMAIAKNLSVAMKNAVGKERYAAYLLLAEANDDLRLAAGNTNGKHKAPAAN